MKPFNFSKDVDKDEEVMSFLPPPKEVRIPNRSKRRSRHSQANKVQNGVDRYADGDRFCLPWMIESIAIMMIITSAFLLKYFYAHLMGHSEEREVVIWENLKLSNIQNWCLDENPMSCKCASPLTPKPRDGHKTWTQAHLENKEDAANIRSNLLDVAFFGDSIMEGWKGTSFGQAMNSKKGNLDIFESMFDSTKGGDFDGLILAIAGDKSPNLLWRIQNGELPESLNAKVFWILIGTNDLLVKGHCSAKVVTIGVKRVVREVLTLRPNATIVINQILPRAPGTHDGKLYGDDETRNITNAINKVNDELEVFCNQYDKLECFDASGIFLKRNKILGDGINGEYIPSNLMKDHLHPTKFGYSLLGEKIVEKLHNISNSSV